MELQKILIKSNLNFLNLNELNELNKIFLNNKDDISNFFNVFFNICNNEQQNINDFDIYNWNVINKSIIEKMESLWKLYNSLWLNDFIQYLKVSLERIEKNKINNIDLQKWYILSLWIILEYFKDENINYNINDLLNNNMKKWLLNYWIEIEFNNNFIPIDVEKIENQYLKEKILNMIETKWNIFCKIYNADALEWLDLINDNIIDDIYIDPPYNTKLNNLTYKDNNNDFQWMVFQNKVLDKLYKKLTKNWTIFASIDIKGIKDMLFCFNNVFKKNEFISLINWQKTFNPSNLSKKIKNVTEFIVCYEKNKDNKKIYIDENKCIENDGDSPLLNTWEWNKQLLFKKWSVIFKINDWIYKKWNHNKIVLLNDLVVESWLNKNEFVCVWNFKWSQDFLNEEIEKGTQLIIKSNKLSIRFKRNNKGLSIPTNIIQDKNITTEKSNKEIYNLFWKSIFTYAKPINLTTKLLSFVSNNNNVWSKTILDCYWWSWTTFESILNMNKTDWIKRNIILFEKDKNIFENILLWRVIKLMFNEKWNKWKPIGKKWNLLINEYFI